MTLPFQVHDEERGLLAAFALLSDAFAYGEAQANPTLLTLVMLLSDVQARLVWREDKWVVAAGQDELRSHPAFSAPTLEWEADIA